MHFTVVFVWHELLYVMEGNLYVSLFRFFVELEDRLRVVVEFVNQARINQKRVGHSFQYFLHLFVFLYVTVLQSAVVKQSALHLNVSGGSADHLDLRMNFCFTDAVQSRLHLLV